MAYPTPWMKLHTLINETYKYSTTTDSNSVKMFLLSNMYIKIHTIGQSVAVRASVDTPLRDSMGKISLAPRPSRAPCERGSGI